MDCLVDGDLTKCRWMKVFVNSRIQKALSKVWRPRGANVRLITYCFKLTKFEPKLRYYVQF